MHHSFFHTVLPQLPPAQAATTIHTATLHIPIDMTTATKTTTSIAPTTGTSNTNTITILLPALRLPL